MYLMAYSDEGGKETRGRIKILEDERNSSITTGANGKRRNPSVRSAAGDKNEGGGFGSVRYGGRTCQPHTRRMRYKILFISRGPSL